VTSDQALVQLLENQIAIMKTLQWLVKDEDQLEELKDLVVMTSNMLDFKDAP
jgi:hypothetical protein